MLTPFKLAGANFSWLGWSLVHMLNRPPNVEDLGIFKPGESSFFGFKAPLSSFHRNKWVSASNTLSRFTVTSSRTVYSPAVLETFMDSTSVLANVSISILLCWICGSQLVVPVTLHFSL